MKNEMHSSGQKTFSRRSILYSGVALAGLTACTTTCPCAIDPKALREFLPNTIPVELYLSDPAGAGPFIEFEYDRYNPAERPVGVCLSGGGIRAYSAAIGQLRALTHWTSASGVKINFLDYVGAISSVSGGTWFNTVYHYADHSISDDVLLGPMVHPKDLTRADVSKVQSGFIGGPLTKATNSKVDEFVVQFFENEEPWDTLWSRAVNHLYFKDFGMGDLNRSFSLDGGGPLNAYSVRSKRPYYIANATQLSPKAPSASEKCPSDVKDFRRHFEYTPLYSGTAQLFDEICPSRNIFGGGYISTSAFNTLPPGSDSAPYAVKTPNPLFTLSDAAGSSSAAPEAFFDGMSWYDPLKYLGKLFPSFNYWSPLNPAQEKADCYPFGDGGSLEDTAIVPLLRRQYPTVIAFVNGEMKIGEDSKYTVSGISGQISRLFGLNPPISKEADQNDQDTQLFGRTKEEGAALFKTLSTALNSQKDAVATHTGIYTIYPKNSFDIPAYPSEAIDHHLGDGQVRVIWMYLNENKDWVKAIKENPDSFIGELLNSQSEKMNFTNFPHFNTFGPNKQDGIHEIYYLTIEQIQLMANLTSYNVSTGAGAAALHEVEGEILNRPRN